MKKYSFFKYLLFLIPLLLVIKIFSPWFINGEINAGDWPYYAKGMLEDFTIIPPLWNGQNGVGLGGVNPNFPLYVYQYFTIGLFVNILHIPWVFVYKVVWYGLSLLLGISSSVVLYKSIRSKPSLWELSISTFLYICNSYFLMIASGGQLGVVLAYSVAPLVLAYAIKSTQVFAKHINTIVLLHSGLLLGLFLSLEVLFDSRISYLTVGTIILYFIYYYLFIEKFNLNAFVKHFIIWILTVFVLHSFWIIPFYLFKLLYLPYVITSSNIFSFFSFADFSHALAFLHPNWPDNVFGKIYFLQPEFLLYPLIAFSGLIFVKKKERSTATYLFFVLLSLIGVFMAKGVNDPFGQVNSWLFNHVPGFNLFRDPTKYYLFIAISYSILIPISLEHIVVWISKKLSVKYIPFAQNCIILMAIVALCIPIRNAVLGNLNGTMKYNPVPKEYLDLGESISGEKDFFRTLWVPSTPRFRFASESHTALSANELFNTSSPSATLNILAKQETKKYLERVNVKYIIIPFDSTSEIFLTERKYDEKKRKEVENELDKIGYKKISLGRLTIYELPNLVDHFSIDSKSVKSTKLSTSEYEVSVNTPQDKILLFSEAYHPGWVALVNNQKIESKKTSDGLNSFMLSKGAYTMRVVFVPSQYEIYFYYLSGLSLIGILIFLYFTLTKERG